MNYLLLFRPGIQKKSSTNEVNEKVLPADLAAAYACYHTNLVEQRKLEQKLQGIDIETKQMKRSFRRQRGILERELKETESNYWSCHRVFSAETLITESDSYKRRFYTGPQPTKAKLPRRTLEHLSQLLRSLKAEEDLETLLRFQGCKRYARRSEAPILQSVSSLNLSRGNYTELDSWELHVTELQNGSSTDSVDRLSSNTPVRVKRIRSAPVRGASRKRDLSAWNERRHSVCSRQYSPKKLDGTSKCSTSKAQERSGITFSGNKEKTSVRFAWVEKEKQDDTVDDAVHDPPSAVVLEQSREVYQGKTSPQSSGEQSRDTDLLPTSSEHGTWQVREDSASHQEQMRRESPCFEHLQRREAEVAELGSSNHTFSNTCQEQARVESAAVEEQRTGDEKLDRTDHDSENVNTKDTTTSSKGWSLIKSAFMVNKESSAPNSRRVFENEDLARVSEKRGKGRDVSLSELDDECSSWKHVEFQGNDNEIQHLTQRKREEENAEVTANNMRDLALYGNEGSKARMLHRGADHVAQRKGSRKMSIALPKSSLHGLSSCRKSLTPRTQHKPPQKNLSPSKNAQDEQEASNNPVKRNPPANILIGDFAKMPREEKQLTDVRKKRRVSVFKRACLSEALFSEQAQVESQLRNRVQCFLGTVDNVDETSERETGEEELQ